MEVKPQILRVPRSMDNMSFGITKKHYEKEDIDMLNEHYGIFLINMICNEVKFTFDNKKEIFSIKKGLTN